MPITRVGVLRGALARTLLLILLLGSSYYVLAVLFGGGIAGVKLQFIILPLFAVALAVYAGSMVELFFVWKYSHAVAAALRTVGLAAFLGLLLATLPSQINLRLGSVTIFIMLFGVSYAIGQLLAVNGGPRLVLYRTVPIVLLGVLLWQSWLALAPSTAGAAMPLYGMVVTAALSLLALLKGHANPIASGVGAFFLRTSNLALVGGLGTFLLLYFTSIRAMIIKAIPDQVILIEWGLVVLIAFLVARRFLAYFRRRSALGDMAEWTQLVQRIGRNKGEVERTSAIVRAFIEEGRKEPLLAHLAILLGREGVDEDEVAEAISPLVQYREEEAPPLLRWLQGDRLRSQRARRAEVVRACMERSGLSPRLGTEVR
jgi:hypothetical protein